MVGKAQIQVLYLKTPCVCKFGIVNGLHRILQFPETFSCIQKLLVCHRDSLILWGMTSLYIIGFSLGLLHF